MFQKTVLSNFVSASLLVGALVVGTAQAQEPAKPELKVGFVPGPYFDGFKAGVAPELQKKGYRRARREDLAAPAMEHCRDAGAG
jgi:D-methionine transport system substrate-binding protein